MKTSLRSLFLAVLAILALICFSYPPAYAGDEGKLEIVDGIIHFPESAAPKVKLEEIKNNFPPNSPPEILAIQG